MAAPPSPLTPALIFLPPAGVTPAEQWMAAARQACAADLIERLRAAGFGPFTLVASEHETASSLSATDVELSAEVETPFHFGRVLAQVVQARRFDEVAYFGAASAPLATADILAGWRDQARQLAGNGVLVNNLYSTDWAILDDARRVVGLAERLPTDNPLGWVLSREAGVMVRTPPAVSAARSDVDTPGDLALLRRHPDLGPHLKQALEAFPEDLGRRADSLAQILQTPAESLALIGRVSETAWREIVRRSQVWVRVFAEERGMRASGRLARGEVSSLLAEMVEERGAPPFVARLEQLVDGVLWDTRVWMAHRGPWPSAADRMASDLGWTDDVGDPALRSLTHAVAQSRRPMLTGGQGVVAGSLRAFVESVMPAGEG
jgi:hypothetical protein